MKNFDPRALRSAFGSYMTGVTVVTAVAENGTPVGFTANSFTSVSLDPPLLLVCPGEHLSSFDVFRTCTFFAVNILAEGQEEVSNVFASSKGSRFEEVDWIADKFGAPLIDGAAASFSCTTHDQMDCGDHCILVGRVVDFSATETPGLGYCQGGYFCLSNERMAQAAALAGRSTRVGAIIEHEGAIYVRKQDAAFDLPTITLEAQMGTRSAIGSHLESLGLRARLGRVYSVFDDAGRGEKFIFFTAKLTQLPADVEQHFLPLAQIPETLWPSDAITAMMVRYHRECANNCFGLYIVDSEVGEVHHDNQA
ncbi:MAG: flavin reductase family protein [Rhizobiaceae bacterium]